MNKNVLVIGGMDPSGCTGIAADLRTLMAWRMYGMAVATAITAQNTERVEGVYPVPMEVIGSQLESVVNDIEIHAIKIGLMPNAMTLELVVELLRTFRLTQGIVVDPIFKSSNGFPLADEKTIHVYKEKLIPLAEAVTPNLDEASTLSGIEVHDVGTMKEAAERIYRLGTRNVVITGGHLKDRAMDIHYDGVKHSVFDAPRVASSHTSGLGDTFASILAVHLARKQKIVTAIDPAKKYIVRALVHPFKIGKGNGPLNHNVAI